MKKLTSLCKRLQFTRLCLFAPSLFIACQIHHGGTREASGPNGAEMPQASPGTGQAQLRNQNSRRFSTRLVKVATIPGVTPESLAEIHSDECIGTDYGALKLRIKLNSLFGNHLIQLALPSTQEVVVAHAATFVGPPAPSPLASLPSPRLEISADGYKMHVAESPKSLLGLQEHLCKRPPEVVANDSLVSDLQTLLTNIAPDCESFDFTLGSYRCELPITTPDKAKRELDELRTTMIRRWSRQPYVLARRLALGMQLAETLAAETSEQSLQTFCKIIKHSLPIELPATFASSRWQVAVCTSDFEFEQRRNAAAFGLAKAVTEIEFLRQLFERTSKLGNLTLKLPEHAVPSGDIWVSLRPEPDVAERLAKEAAQLWLHKSPKNASKTTSEQASSCWHPLYAENDYLMLLARHLMLAGKSSHMECDSEKSEALALERYVTDSITSETEFLMPNRQSRTLRLPIGSYHYELRGMPDDPSEWDDAAQLETRTAGRIVWDDKRPRPIISVW